MNVLEIQPGQQTLCCPTGNDQCGVSSLRGDVTEELVECADLSGSYTLDDAIRCALSRADAVFLADKGIFPCS
jgi:hypothetical protein